MKAIVYTQYGSPAVLQMAEVKKPVPRDNEIVLRVMAVSLNPYDWHLMRGEPFLARLHAGLFAPKHPILGNDAAGQVEAVGKKVTQFKVGDEVVVSCKFGGLAEYVAVPEDLAVYKAHTVSMVQAATLPIAGLTALQGLRDNGHIKPKQKVLVNGASGGVGTFAVQLARFLGADVTGVCSTGNVAMVRSIGANAVVDYKTDQITTLGLTYDLVLDAVGNFTLKDFNTLTSPKGIGVAVGYTSMAQLMQLKLGGPFAKKAFSFCHAKMNGKDLALLMRLMGSGDIKAVIDRQYPMVQTAEAMDYLEQGHAKGKVVVTF